MRILLIRHGDPDYDNDTLTEKGRREAALLAEAAPHMNLGTCFVSPLGRAQDTAAYSLKKIGRTAETIDWLEEFSGQIDLNRHPEMEKATTPQSEAQLRARRRAGTTAIITTPSPWQARMKSIVLSSMPPQPPWQG